MSRVETEELRHVPVPVVGAAGGIGPPFPPLFFCPTLGEPTCGMME